MKENIKDYLFIKKEEIYKDEEIKINNGYLKREDILKSFTPEILNKAWNCLCEFIAQNYESGKGTVIKVQIILVNLILDGV